VSHSPQTIIIAGGGIAGMTLAVLLKQALASGVQVVVCDPAAAEAAQKAPEDNPLRVSALAADGRRLLQGLGVWDAVSASAQAIASMEITDSALADPVRAKLLSLSGDVGAGEPFAHMLANDDVLHALAKAAVEAGVELCDARVERWLWNGAAAGSSGMARLSDGSRRQASLLVAADGARSNLRALAGIGWHGWGYGQTAIVATLAHERPHGGRAIQHFLPSGPFAILPLTGNRSSIVWTERAADVPALLAMDAEDMLTEIRRRFGLERGSLRLETWPVGAFPLALGVARRFYADGLALVGDAAHQVHPIAGQGLNLGLRDVMTLGDALVEAIRIGLPAGEMNLLRAYDRNRRADVIAMATVTDGLNRLFSSDFTPLRLIRGLGARLAGRSSVVKQMLIREAAGVGASTRD